jgi:hypothetical protein
MTVSFDDIYDYDPTRPRKRPDLLSALPRIPY